MNLVRNSVLNSAEYGLQHNSTSPPPPSHTLSVFTARLLYEGGGGGVREKEEGQQYTRVVENTNMTDCISSL